MLCHQPPAIYRPVAAISKDKKDTHTDTKRHTHTDSRFDEPTIQHLINNRSQSKKLKSEPRALMLANLVPFPPTRLTEAQSRSWPLSDTFGCWNVEVTCHEGPSRLRRGLTPLSPRIPAHPLDRLYKLTPFLRRRVGGGSLAVAAVRDGTSFPRAFAARHPRKYLSREKPNYYCWRETTFEEHQNKQTSTTNQPTNQHQHLRKNVCQQHRQDLVKRNKFSLVLLWGSFKDPINKYFKNYW